VNKTILIFTLVAACNSFAQEDMTVNSSGSQQAAASDGKPDLVFADKNKKIKLNFGDELVTGASATTDVTLMDSKKGAAMKKLIRIRENFNSNMEKGRYEFRSR